MAVLARVRANPSLHGTCRGKPRQAPELNNYMKLYVTDDGILI